jgi:hypothetical protein
VNNTKIPCSLEEFHKNAKTHLSCTVVGIKQLGYTYAPWKKNKKSGEKPEGTKKLFEEGQSLCVQHERIYTSCKVYSFPREGKADKGPRVDESCTIIELGQTLHFMLFDFMYEKKSKGENVFDDSTGDIDPFSIVELVVSPATMEQYEKGYALTINSVRKLPFTLHSYMSPINKQALATTYDALHEKMCGMKEKESMGLRMQLDSTNMGFLCKINKNAFIADHTVEDMFKLVCEDGAVTAGVLSLDVCKKDLLFFTNAGEDEMYARLLLEIASAADCLYFWVYRNEYYTRGDKDLTEFRGVPLVDTDMLLDFVDVNLSGEETCTKLTLPFDMPNFEGASLLINHTPERVDGNDSITAPDFVLCSGNTAVDRAYRLWIGNESKPMMMSLLFRSLGGAGSKRASSRINWNDYLAD